jgi:hypothetical protein
VFLDIRRDRYFALPTTAEQAFQRFAAQAALGGKDRAALETIVANGLLEPCTQSVFPRPCPPGPEPTISLLDRKARSRPAEVLGALSRLALAGFALRVRSLSSTLQSFERRKTAARPRAGEHDRLLLEVAAAFKVTRLMASPLDRCLPRSLAAAHRLLDRGVVPELVFGIRLQPFTAHCWVRHGNVLVNESLDQVRNFTPILTL